jgi:archaemetzincin
VVMAVGILPIRQVDATILLRIKEDLVKIFPETSCSIIGEQLPLSERDFDKNRKQYRSNIILNALQGYAIKRKDYARVLGVVDADIFVPELNFVFGEAICPGNAALISLWRLKPEFYKDPPNMELFAVRSVKEAVHEIGHTLGLRHCQRSSCVMHFSNSIFDTDKKQTLFCDECYLQAALAINSLEKTF